MVGHHVGRSQTPPLRLEGLEEFCFGKVFLLSVSLSQYFIICIRFWNGWANEDPLLREHAQFRR